LRDASRGTPELWTAGWIHRHRKSSCELAGPSIGKMFGQPSLQQSGTTSPELTTASRWVSMPDAHPYVPWVFQASCGD
jgi:hypothetical protein